MKGMSWMSAVTQNKVNADNKCSAYPKAAAPMTCMVMRPNWRNMSTCSPDSASWSRFTMTSSTAWLIVSAYVAR